MLNLRYQGSIEGLMEYIDSQIICHTCMDTGRVMVTTRVYTGEEHMMWEEADCPHLKRINE